MSEWISVKDRLPETEYDGFESKSKPVLVFDGEDMYVTEYSSYGIDLGTVCNFNDDDITHWMPLPEPPKAE